MIHFQKPEFGAEFNPDLVHLLPAVFVMRAEYEETGESAGLMLGFSWLCVTLSVVWT